MNNKRVAKELVRIAKTLIIGESDFITKITTEGECFSFSDRGSNPQLPRACKRRELQRAIDEDYEDLGKYIHDEPLKSLVTKIDTPEVKSSVKNNFTLLWTIHSKAPLGSDEQAQLIRYIDGQCSDGWGEGFEQFAYYREDNDVEHFASCWFHGGRAPTRVVN
jgi:hypothetical protein